MKAPTFLPLLVIPSVAAHGFVSVLNIAGKPYQGNAPNANPNPSIIRQISTTSPVKGASNPFVNCGQSAQLASLNGPANPGDKVTFQWDDGDGGNWPHNTGPMLTYMTNCGSTTCDQVNTSSSKWFKIDQVAKVQGDDSTWLQTVVQKGGVANVTLPNNLAPGNYVIRHEIIALHLGNSMGGAEFYPSCSQITVGGSGTAQPSVDELVLLPGAYHDNDPGIYVPNVFDPSTLYVFPGPPVAQLAVATASTPYGVSSNSTLSSGSGSSSGSTPSGTAPGSNSTSAPSSGSSRGGQCRLKAGSSVATNKRRALHKRHILSRIMNHLSF